MRRVVLPDLKEVLVADLSAHERQQQGEQRGGYCNSPGKRLTPARWEPEVDGLERDLGLPHQRCPSSMPRRTVWTPVQLLSSLARLQRIWEEEL